MYRFRYSPDGGKGWVQARYRMQAVAIRMRHPDHQLLDCETRRAPDDPDAMRAGVVGAPFVPPSVQRRVNPANVEFDPSLHDSERKCVRIFLQRYATWCVRKRRFASAGAAINLARRLGAPSGLRIVGECQ